MKCIIPSQNVKIIARAVQSLAKVGDELFIQTSEDELVLRTVNLAKSAFAEFRMCRSFFSSYSYSPITDIDNNCKITMKSCSSVFKNAHGMDKQVENCEVRLKPEAPHVIFQIKFINTSVKKYYLPVVENDGLEANIPTEAPNQICASSKFLSSAIKNFRHSEDEITLGVNKDKTTIRNHLELRKDMQLMRTELMYHSSEFESYKVGTPTSVTFCLKELRAVCIFAEPASLPILITFSLPARPIVFQVSNHPAYEANYVVSTLQASLSEQSSRSILTRTLAGTEQEAHRTDHQEPASVFSFNEEQTEQQGLVLMESERRNHRLSSPANPNKFICAEEAGPSHAYSNRTVPTLQNCKFGNLSTEVRKSQTEPLSETVNLTHKGKEPTVRTLENAAHEEDLWNCEKEQMAEEVDRILSATVEGERSSGWAGTPKSSLALKEAMVVSESEGVLTNVSTAVSQTGSQHLQHLMKTVFSRCFSKDHFLKVLIGHDILLEPTSDNEIS